MQILSDHTPAPKVRLPSYEHFRDTKIFNSLDGLRCLSIVAVVWHHTAGHWLTGVRLLNVGYLGVHFFFVISGFLITTLLLREKEKHGRISLRNFYMRRSLRIFPLYYTVLLLYIVVVKLVEPASVYGLQFMANLKYFLTYTSNWFVDMTSERVIFYFAWSLATEEQFYLIWPSVESLCKRHWPVVVAFILIALQESVANGLLASLLPANSLARQIIVEISVAICFGVILAHLLHSPRSFALLKRLLGYRMSAPLAFGFLLGCIYLLPRLDPLGVTLVYVGMTMVVGACVIREDHVLAPLLQWSPMQLIGKVSYGIYLLHMLTYNVIKRGLEAVSLNHPLLYFFCTLALVTLLAWLSFRYYESIFLRMKTRFSRA